MEYISIHHSLNEIFHVHESVFKTYINKSLSNHKQIKLNKDISIIFVNNGQNLETTLSVDISKEADVAKEILSLTKDIESSITSLINTKPSNIKVVVNLV